MQLKPNIDLRLQWLAKASDAYIWSQPKEPITALLEDFILKYFDTFSPAEAHKVFADVKDQIFLYKTGAEAYQKSVAKILHHHKNCNTPVLVYMARTQFAPGYARSSWISRNPIVLDDERYSNYQTAESSAKRCKVWVDGDLESLIMQGGTLMIGDKACWNENMRAKTQSCLEKFERWKRA